MLVAGPSSDDEAAAWAGMPLTQRLTRGYASIWAKKTKNRTELTETETETEVTETEVFGPRFGFRFPETEIITVNSVPALG